MFSGKIIFKNLLDSSPLPSPPQGLWITVDKHAQAFENNEEFAAYIFRLVLKLSA
jgi:hypothetical protein